MHKIDLTQHGIHVSEVHHNLPPSALYEHTIRYEKNATIADKMLKHNARVWLVNTGWGGGGYGVGKRISLRNTRAIVDAIHDGSLAKAKTERDPVFGVDVVTECPNVPAEILIPRNAWSDKSAYEATAKKLNGLFNRNFETYAAGASAEVKAAAPKV